MFMETEKGHFLFPTLLVVTQHCVTTLALTLQVTTAVAVAMKGYHGDVRLKDGWEINAKRNPTRQVRIATDMLVLTC
jgi:hypothetical protein